VTEQDLQLLKGSVNKIVRIVCHDGETMIAKVRAVSDENQDDIYDLVSTTKESQYEKHDEQPAYLIKFEDIERVEPVRSS
jgi:small nuclear ribonucleoprotein (snRNP)-like protein